MPKACRALSAASSSVKKDARPVLREWMGVMGAAEMRARAWGGPFEWERRLRGGASTMGEKRSLSVLVLELEFESPLLLDRQRRGATTKEWRLLDEALENVEALRLSANIIGEISGGGLVRDGRQQVVRVERRARAEKNGNGVDRLLLTSVDASCTPTPTSSSRAST